MASELRVDTLKDSAGNNSVGMSYVSNGSAKAWVSFNGTGTIAILDSFSVASISDHGTGQYSVTMSNALSNANYSLGTAVGDGTGQNNRSISTGQGSAPTTTNYRLTSITASSGAIDDCAYLSSNVMGDLA